jgi:antitoxin component YwqK of YwqJK toxin-antitoxin module
MNRIKYILIILIILFSIFEVSSQETIIDNPVYKPKHSQFTIEELNSYLREHINCLNSNEEYIIQFVVETTGTISDLKQSKETLDKTCLLKVKMMIGTWIPGKNIDREPVRVLFNLTLPSKQNNTTIEPIKEVSLANQNDAIVEPTKAVSEAKNKTTITTANYTYPKSIKPIDNKTGEIEATYENGNVKKRRIDVAGTNTPVHYSKGTNRYEYITYYSNGVIQTKTQWMGGKKHGDDILCYESGSIHYKKKFEFDKQIGESIMYYENGNLKAKRTYINGKQNGEEVSFYESGKLDRKGNYTDGKMNGEFVGYYENGNPRSVMFIKGGETEGEYLLFYENGKIKQKQIFKNGFPDGLTLSFDENGNPK